MTVQTTYGFVTVPAYPGAMDGGPSDVKTMRNDEASNELAFGRAVKFNSTTDRFSAARPSVNTDLIAGIVALAYNYGKEELGATGVKPASVLNVIRKGRVWVETDAAVNIGQRAFIRVAGGTVGVFRAAADGSNTIDSGGQVVFLTPTSGAGLALVEVDFTNKPA